jgi:hypothetical protein
LRPHHTVPEISEIQARADAKGWQIGYRCIDPGKPPVWPMSIAARRSTQ